MVATDYPWKTAKSLTFPVGLKCWQFQCLSVRFSSSQRIPWRSGLAGSRCRETQEITFEIGTQGQYGPEINDPKRPMFFERCRGGRSWRWKLVCIMYAEFKRIEPGMDIGVDLGEEWKRRRGWEEKKVPEIDAQSRPWMHKALQKAANGPMARGRQYAQCAWGARQEDGW